MNSEEREVKRLRIRGAVHGDGIPGVGGARGPGARPQGLGAQPPRRIGGGRGRWPACCRRGSRGALPLRAAARQGRSRSTSRRRASSTSATAARWRIFRCSRRSNPVFPPRLRSGFGEGEGRLPFAPHRPEHRLELPPQRLVDLVHARGAAEVAQARHPVSGGRRRRRGRCRQSATRSGSTLRLMPCRLTQRRTRMPMAAILSSRPAPESGPAHPDADAVLAPLARDVEGARASGSAIPRGRPRSSARRPPRRLRSSIT